MIYYLSEKSVHALDLRLYSSLPIHRAILNFKCWAPKFFSQVNKIMFLFLKPHVRISFSKVFLPNPCYDPE